MPSKTNTRREFIGKSASAAALGGMVPYFSWSQPAFANHAKNDRPRIGCIGVGSMGTGDAKGHANFGDILAVCDVDQRHADRAKNDESIGKGTADSYKDYRKILDRDDIDVVSVVTPDHWHVKIAIEALEAGKHVFCQKPLTLTLEENQLIRKACKKHEDKVFFIGTQQRSDRAKFLRAINMVQKGILGDIQKITVGINGGDQGGPFPVVMPPFELDWEKWLGQAPLVDYREKRCHYQFRWWYEYSGGKFTDWGAHHVDIATWAIGQDGDGMGPVEIDGTDAKHPCEFKDGWPTQDDRYNTAHDYSVKCKFQNGIIMDVTSRTDNGILFEGTKGKIFVNRGKITGKPIEENWDEGQYTEEDQRRLYKGKQPEGHKQNFYRCLGRRRFTCFRRLTLTCRPCRRAIWRPSRHVLGRVIQWDPQAEKICR
jgi:predicted dehydrogenase